MSEPESMAERIARAIADAEGGSWEGFTWDGLNEAGRDKFRVDARAVIEAMMEPTEAEVDAALCAAEEDPLWSKRGPAESVRTIYRAMIQAALNPIGG